MPARRIALSCSAAAALIAPAVLPAPSVAFSPGIVANGGSDHAAQDRAFVAAQRLGARRVRVGFRASEPLRTVRDQHDDAAARGMEIIPVLEADGAGPDAGSAGNVAAWVRDLGPGGPNADSKPIRFVEFGNENSYNGSGKAGPSGGRAYANRYRAYYDAINGSRGNTRVGLLAQADDAGTGSAQWVNGMKAAQPRICQMVADGGGWTVHAYGPVDGYVQSGASGERRWRERLGRLVEQTRDIGCSSSIPIDITEEGLATRDGRALQARPGSFSATADNFGWRRNLTFGQAGDGLRRKVDALRGMSGVGSRLRLWLFFQAMDGRPWSDRTSHREAWWGALRQDYGEKGALTDAVRSIMRR